MPELLVAILSGLCGMLGWGFADFFAKKVIDRIGDVPSLFWTQCVGIVPLGIVFAYQPSWPHLNTPGWLWLMLLGVWSGLSYIPTYVAFGKGKVSLLSPIFASYAVVVAILSSIFFHEVIPLYRQLAFAVVFLGVVFINGNPRDIWLLMTGQRKRGESDIKGLPEILLAVCLYSLWLIALDRFIHGMSWIPILLVIRIFSAVALFLYASATGKRLVFSDTGLWKFIFLVGLFDVEAFAAVSYGFSAISPPKRRRDAEWGIFPADHPSRSRLPQGEIDEAPGHRQFRRDWGNHARGIALRIWNCMRQ